MAIYAWKGKNRYGDAVGGERVAKTPAELMRALQREQITVFNVKKKPAELKLAFLERHKVPIKDLSVYSRQLSVLIDADLPLIQSLTMLAEQTTNKYFKTVINSVKKDVESGSTLHQAKKKFPKVFDSLYCNLVGSGEESGSLDVMLRRLAEYQEKVVKLRAQVKQAMMYPVAILSFSVVVVIFMMWKIVPIFAGIFSELGADLPFLTKIVMIFSNFVQSYILFIILGSVGFLFFFRYFKQTTGGRRIVDGALLKMPLFGSMVQKVALSRITRTLATLLTGGVPMLESLKITSTTAGNVVIETRLMKSRTKVSEGSSLTDALKEHGHLPYMFYQMVGVGEATGNLDSMLSKLADFYDDEVETTVGALLSVLEPILLIFVGMLVGGIVISMYLPVFNLIQQF